MTGCRPGLWGIRAGTTRAQLSLPSTSGVRAHQRNAGRSTNLPANGLLLFTVSATVCTAQSRTSVWCEASPFACPAEHTVAIPWLVEGFSVDTHTEDLLRLQRRLESDGELVFEARKMLIEARKGS